MHWWPFCSKFRLASAIMKYDFFAFFICVPPNSPPTQKKITDLLKVYLIEFSGKQIVRNNGIRKIWQVISKLPNLGLLINKSTLFGSETSFSLNSYDAVWDDVLRMTVRC